MNWKSLFGRKEKPPVCSAVIVAAGSSQRMGSVKLMLRLGAATVLGRSILAFENCPLVDEIVIVTRNERLEEIAKYCHDNGTYTLDHGFHIQSDIDDRSRIVQDKQTDDRNDHMQSHDRGRNKTGHL